MPTSPSGPVRRAQLIVPFGTGSMVVVVGGTSLVVAGLDYWYQQANDKKKIDTKEFIIEEWRLQNLLGVDHFCLPPDYREYTRGQEVPNIGITIPAFRFPTWHFCPFCRLLRSWPMYAKGSRGRLKCPECEAKKKNYNFMHQVPFVAMCERGHLQDFPWNEWVHHDPNPKCKGPLRLTSTGSASLGGQKVKCDGCGKVRNLGGITSDTMLSKSLSKGAEFLCQGMRPWLGPNSQETCNAPIRGSLRSASNLYFARVYSSIYLPRMLDINLQKIEEILVSPPLSTLLTIFRDFGEKDLAKITKTLRDQQTRLLVEFTDDQILKVIEKLFTQGSIDDQIGQDSSISEDEHTSFRRVEYRALLTEHHDLQLIIREGDLNTYEAGISRYFSRIMLVNKLRETRTLAGFSRIYPENDKDRVQMQSILWKNMPSDPRERWLPAYIVYGEGIFFEFNETLLRKWENKYEVLARTRPLLDRFKVMQEIRRLKDRPIGPRFILLHTFAHIIMNRLTFECGYSSAALRERLYISDNIAAPMAGVLIYTADGDSEGTMGGLVRMGKPGYIEPVIQRALENACWCSADPVCMEMGKHIGQGPDSCNLAACHNCALVPETACEEFNRFLDRAMVIGEIDNPEIGFFDIRKHQVNN